MRIDSIGPGSFGTEAKKTNSPGSAGADFAAQIKEALQGANRQQVEAEKATESFIAGEMDNLHQLLILTEQAQLSLQLTVQMTNKAVEAYQEISRMQV